MRSTRLQSRYIGSIIKTDNPDNHLPMPERECRYFVSRKYFVDYLNSPHYQSNIEIINHVPVISAIPYLWTSELTSCIGIGLIRQSKDHKPAAIGLYHSNGEHADVSAYISRKLVQAVKSFLKACDRTDEIKIIMAFNIGIHSDDESRYALDIELIKQLFNKCCKDSSLPLIPNSNFIIFKCDATFYIKSDGQYGSFLDFSKDNRLLENLKAMIIRHSAETKFVDGCFSESTKKKHEINRILQIINRVEPGNFISTMQAFQDILEIAETNVFAPRTFFSHKLAHGRLIFLKILAWDPVLNQPSAIILDDWLARNGHSVTPSLRKKITAKNDIQESLIPPYKYKRHI